MGRYLPGVKFNKYIFTVFQVLERGGRALYVRLQTLNPTSAWTKVDLEHLIDELQNIKEFHIAVGLSMTKRTSPVKVIQTYHYWQFGANRKNRKTWMEIETRVKSSVVEET